MSDFALQTHGLAFQYDDKPILHDLDLSFEKGKLTVILGPNGSGKTTLLRLLDGLLRPDAGEIRLGNGTALSSLSGKALARRIAFLPQNRPVPDIPAEMLVSHGRFPHLGLSRKLTAADRAIVENAMQQTGTTDFAQRALPTLSGGERQRVYLAMLLAQDTEILLLDEPTTYLDARHKLEILALLRRLTESGRTVVAVLHDLPLALSFADRVILLENGTCTASGTPETVCAAGTPDRVFGIRLKRTVLDGEILYAELPER